MGETFEVRGRVIADDGQPLTGIRVILDGKRSVESAADGTFSFEGLQESTSYSMWARHDDLYAPMASVRTADDVELRMRRGTTFVARVLADGAPLAGATVALTNTIRAITDERGVATIRGVPARAFQGQVLADGRATHYLALTVAEDGGMIQQTIELARGAEVSGRVLDRSGRPLDDVWVRINDETSKQVAETSPHPDGSWRVSMGAGRYRVRAEAGPRKTFEPIAVDCDGETAIRDLVLRVGDPKIPGARITGVVVDEDGRPAEGARIVVSSHRRFHWFGSVDAAGHFESRELDEGEEVDVAVSWGNVRGEIRQRVRVGEPGLRLVLPSGATFVGRALLDGEPVPYFGFCLVRADVFFHADWPTGVRREDGRFVVRHVPPGPWRIALLGPGLRLVTTDEIQVTGNETIELGDVALARGHRITGVVRDKSGAPVAGAHVLVGRPSAMKESKIVHSRIARWFHGQYDTTTDDNGAYVLDGISVHTHPEFPEVIWATHPSAGESVIRELLPGDATLDFVLVGRGRIEGSVARSGTVIAVRADEPVYARSRQAMEGKFAFDVPPGEYVVRRWTEESPSTTVTVLADQTVRVEI